MTLVNRYIGSPVERVEDLRFSARPRQYVGDLAPRHAARRNPAQPGCARPYPPIEAKPALGIPGVRATITAAEIAGSLGTVPHVPLRLQTSPATEPFRQPVIAADRVRYVGEPVALVVADNAAPAEDALDASGSSRRIAGCRRPHIRSARDAAVRGAGTNLRNGVPRPDGRRRGGFPRCGIYRAANVSACSVTPRCRWSRADFWRMGSGAGRLTVSGAAKVPFFNRRTLAYMLGFAETGGRTDRERCRRRLRRARRVLSRGFPDPVRGATRRSAGAMDRGPPRAPDRDEPCARNGCRRRNRLQTRRHDPCGCAATWTSISAPTSAPTG